MAKKTKAKPKKRKPGPREERLIIVDPEEAIKKLLKAKETKG